MGQKVNPIGFRLVIDPEDWESRWFAKKAEYPQFLYEDYMIRNYLKKKLKFASVWRVFIERAGNRLRVTIHTAKPGIVIGRKGQELDTLKSELQKMTKNEILLDIQEIKKPDLVAELIAQGVALQLERRISFRRAMKKAVQTAMSMGALGIKIQSAGRLGGADIARTESQREGSVPLHTLRQKIDYGFAEANTVYGIIGVKCWLCLENESKK